MKFEDLEKKLNDTKEILKHISKSLITVEKNSFAIAKDIDNLKIMGEKMKEIIPGTTDAAVEKHVPVISQEGNIVTVSVGSVEHPMIPEHYIEWISLETNKGNQRKVLQPNTPPTAQFALLDGEEVITAYAYCNLHSLWKA